MTAGSMRDGYIDKVYGRRQAKPLKPRQAALIDALLPKLAIPDGDAPIDLEALFPGCDEFHFEIGFGGGEHLAWQAQARPGAGFIGAEPFLNGVGKLLAQVDDLGLANVRVVCGDARPALARTPDAALARLYVLHPDPWPKKRHHKRRMVSPWLFAEAARTLKVGGEMRVSSDRADYLRTTLMHARAEPRLVWTARTAADWRVPPADWPETRYGAKARLAGRPPAHLIFQRAPGPDR
ncbi:MAG: tRNA (guanine(46)-N(7))-methyltransferase TrmB [Parvularculaceae bacterium]